MRLAYPGGIDARTAVWMWRRILEVLGWAHRCGISHRAVLPEHILVHPRDHRVLLVGWSSATGDLSFSRDDLRSSARCTLDLTKGDVPAPLGALLVATASDRADVPEAWALSRAVADAAGLAAFGPPKFHPFTMPGLALKGATNKTGDHHGIRTLQPRSTRSPHARSR